VANGVTYLLDTNAISDLMRAAPGIEHWMAGLDRDDRVVTCTITRGEILFGIARLPAGRRRTELEETGRQFLAVFRCEPVPERAADFYAAVKLARQQRGLTLDENDLWVARRRSHSVRRWSAAMRNSQDLLIGATMGWQDQ
jgi:predicted nucleic acid-binding protein